LQIQAGRASGRPDTASRSQPVAAIDRELIVSLAGLTRGHRLMVALDTMEELVRPRRRDGQRDHWISRKPVRPVPEVRIIAAAGRCQRAFPGADGGWLTWTEPVRAALLAALTSNRLQSADALNETLGQTSRTRSACTWRRTCLTGYTMLQPSRRSVPL